mmetsp:Transcript_19829/g.63792  ORF Transcript_19829/g.63792 Transcript_19829/m.63792 type:complete len:307 (-) Transcript_19829:3847-4767(-)
MLSAALSSCASLMRCSLDQGSQEAAPRPGSGEPCHGVGGAADKEYHRGSVHLRPGGRRWAQRTWPPAGVCSPRHQPPRPPASAVFAGSSVAQSFRRPAKRSRRARPPLARASSRTRRRRSLRGGPPRVRRERTRLPGPRAQLASPGASHDPRRGDQGRRTRVPRAAGREGPRRRDEGDRRDGQTRRPSLRRTLTQTPPRGPPPYVRSAVSCDRDRPDSGDQDPGPLLECYDRVIEFLRGRTDPTRGRPIRRRRRRTTRAGRAADDTLPAGGLFAGRPDDGVGTLALPLARMTTPIRRRRTRRGGQR